jgi:hypothetical protein
MSKDNAKHLLNRNIAIMNKSVREELEQYVISSIQEGTINAENIDDAHHILFNQDYYIIGYYQADQWLKEHDITPWEAIGYVIEQEREHFGEATIKADGVNSEFIVNNLVFFAGYELDIERMFEEYAEEVAA